MPINFISNFVLDFVDPKCNSKVLEFQITDDRTNFPIAEAGSPEF